MQEKRDELKKKLLSKKKSELGDLKNYQSIHTAKNEKACFEENTDKNTYLDNPSIKTYEVP